MSNTWDQILMMYFPVIFQILWLSNLYFATAIKSLMKSERPVSKTHVSKKWVLKFSRKKTQDGSDVSRVFLDRPVHTSNQRSPHHDWHWLGNFCQICAPRCSKNACGDPVSA